MSDTQPDTQQDSNRSLIGRRVKLGQGIYRVVDYWGNNRFVLLRGDRKVLASRKFFTVLKEN